MTDIVTRAGKGSDLTYAEIDENWENLNADKAEKPTAGVVAAAGTTQADATAIAADINNLSSSANNQGVRLPAATAGARVVVSNTSGGRNIYVYPASGEQIDVYATNAPFTLAAYALVEVFCAVAGLWQSTIRAAQSTSYFTSTIPANKGGTGASSYAVGDMLYADSTTTLAKLIVGTNGHVLTLAAGVPTWAAGGLTLAQTQAAALCF